MRPSTKRTSPKSQKLRPQRDIVCFRLLAALQLQMCFATQSLKGRYKRFVTPIQGDLFWAACNPRAALRDLRRCALPWAGLFCPLRGSEVR